MLMNKIRRICFLFTAVLTVAKPHQSTSRFSHKEQI